jgi:hypothetical protein
LSQALGISLLAARVLPVADLPGEVRVEVVPERCVPPQFEAGCMPRLVSLEAGKLAPQRALDA